MGEWGVVMSERVKQLGRLQDRYSLWLFLGTFVVFVITANRIDINVINDTLFVARPAWTLATQGSLNLENLPAFSGTSWTFLFDGHQRTDRFPGAILFTVPFSFVIRTGTFSLISSGVAAAVACAGAVTLMHRVLLTLVSKKTALGAALVLAFGTSVWSVASDAIWTEGPTMLALGLSMWALTQQRWFLAGAGYAFAILCRPHTAVFALVAGVWESRQRRSWLPMIKVGVVSALGFAGLLLWNKVNSGLWDIFPGTYGGRIASATDTNPGGQATSFEWTNDLISTFFAPLRGIFVYSPFLLLVLPGLRRAWKVAPTWVRSSAIGGVVYLVVQLAGNSWIGGPIFGYRLILPSLFAWWPLLVLAYQQWTVRRPWSRITFYVLALVSIWWFAQGALVFPVEYFYTNPLDYVYWRSWNVPLFARFAGVSGWIFGLATAAAVAGAVYVTNDPEPVSVTKPSTKQLKKKQGKKSQSKKSG